MSIPQSFCNMPMREYGSGTSMKFLLYPTLRLKCPSFPLKSSLFSTHSSPDMLQNPVVIKILTQERNCTEWIKPFLYFGNSFTVRCSPWWVCMGLVFHTQESCKLKLNSWLGNLVQSTGTHCKFRKLARSQFEKLSLDFNIDYINSCFVRY